MYTLRSHLNFNYLSSTKKLPNCILNKPLNWKRNPRYLKVDFYPIPLWVPESSKLYMSDRRFLTIPDLFPWNLEILVYWKFQGFIIVSSSIIPFSSGLFRPCSFLWSSRVTSCWCPVQARAVVLLLLNILFPSLIQYWNHFFKYLITILKSLNHRSRRKPRSTDNAKTVQIPVQTTN